MSLKDAQHTLNGMGRTIRQNTPGPAQLWQGFLETHIFSPAFPFLIGIAVLFLFGGPVCYWLTH